MKQYYIPFEPSMDVNYIYVLLLYSIAEYNLVSRCYDTIKYGSQRQLVVMMNDHYQSYGGKVSTSTMRRILADERYQQYFTNNKTNKTIKINNNIRSCNRFVVLSQAEVDLILTEKDILFAKYLIYLKYYCGYSKSRTIDTTAKQFLAATGYSTQSNGYISKISSFNGLLKDKGIIFIKKYRDQFGHERNVYSFK